MQNDSGQVLLVGPEALTVKSKILKGARLRVVEAKSETEALLRLESARFRGAIICSAVGEAERPQLTARLRLIQPGIPVMWLASKHAPSLEIAFRLD